MQVTTFASRGLSLGFNSRFILSCGNLAHCGEKYNDILD